MKKITIELHTGAAMNEDTLKKYLKSLELSERALISVESEPASTYTLHDTNLIAFPINSRIIGPHITHGSILYYGETEEYDIGNDMTSKVDLSAYIERLFDLVEDKKRLLYSTVSHLSTSHTYRDPLRFVRKKDYIIKMMYCAGFVTALEVEAAREIYNKGETEWTGLDYAKSYILSAYLSFAVRDNRTFNRPKYATDYFEFSYYLVKQANGVVNSTYSRYEFERANVEDVVAAHYDTVFKPLLVNLFNTQTKDPTIFRTYTTEVVRVFNSLYYIFNEPKMASDFTNTIALNIENQTPKTVERNIDDIYDWVAPKVQKGLMFNDCGSCKKVKQAVMIKKLGK